jgi:hypothetical protein
MSSQNNFEIGLPITGAWKKEELRVAGAEDAS